MLFWYSSDRSPSLFPDEAGLYGALFIVAKTIFFAGGILGSVLFSMSAEEHDRNGGVKKDSKLFHHALFLSVLFVIASVGFFALFPEFVLRIFFGSRYLAGASLLGWFALGSGLYVLVNFFQQYLLSVHRTRVVWGTLAFSILGAIAMFFLAHDAGSLVRYVVYTQTAALLVSVFHYLREVGYTTSVASSE
jgi:O-antigen/teichoic acid export membrane protein